MAMDLAATLRRLGYDVVALAARGEDAVELARKHQPDLVLMDIMLAGPMDGVQAAENHPQRARRAHRLSHRLLRRSHHRPRR